MSASRTRSSTRPSPSLPGTSGSTSRGAARPAGDQFTIDTITEANERANPGLFRVAHKMATGSGKTVVMAMLIAWHTLNKTASPQDRRFSPPRRPGQLLPGT